MKNIDILQKVMKKPKRKAIFLKRMGHASLLFLKLKYTKLKIYFTICQKSINTFYLATYCMKWDTTSWTYSMFIPKAVQLWEFDPPYCIYLQRADTDTRLNSADTHARAKICNVSVCESCQGVNICKWNSRCLQRTNGPI